MEFGISTQIFRGQSVSVDLLESIRKAGYRRIELFANRPHFDFHDRALLRAIGRWFTENDLPAPSLHLPFIENVSLISSDLKPGEAGDVVQFTLELEYQVPPKSAIRTVPLTVATR